MNRPNANRPQLRALVAASALALGLAAGHALADEPVDAPNVKVSFGDLDLNKQAGAEALYHRIQAAAGSVCARGDGRDIERYRIFRQCYKQSIEAALEQVNHQGLHAVHMQDQGTRVGLNSSQPETPAATMK